MKKIVLVCLVLALSLFAVFCEEKTPDFIKILEKIDAMATFNNMDFSAIFTIVSKKPGEPDDLRQARMFRRDTGNKIVMVVLQPKVNQGQGILKIDDNVWFYDPEGRKFTHSSLKEDFQDSNAKNHDFQASKLAKDYTVTATSSDKLGKMETWLIDLAAKNNEVPYPKLRIWVRKDNLLLMKRQEFSLTGKVMRTSYFPKYTEISGHMIAQTMLFVNELVKGEETQLTLKEPSLAAIPDNVFTKSYIERINQ